jgi:hypothetical protein
MAIDLDTHVTAEPDEMRQAIAHLGDRERDALHHIREVAPSAIADIDLRDG